MSSGNSKRNVESTEANRPTKSSRSERSSASESTWSLPTSSASYVSPSHDERFLRFELGASIEYKVLCTITALAQSRRLETSNRVACIYDATGILDEALKIPESHRDQIVCGKDIDDLQAALDATKTSPELVDRVRSRLRQFENMPFLPLNDVVLQQWHDQATSFIHHCKALMDKCDIEADLHNSRIAIKKLYHKYLHRVETENLIMRKQPPGFESKRPASESFDPRLDYHLLDHRLYKELETNIETARSQGPISQDIVCNKFQSIHKAYDSLCLLLEENNVGKFDHFTIYELARPCRLIGEALTTLLSYTDSEDSLKAQYLERHPDVFCEGSCHKLVSRTKSLIRDQLEERFQELHRLVDEKPNKLLENDFYHLAQLISIFAMKTPVGAVEDDWVKYAPRMLTLVQSEVLMNKLQCLHTRFQDQIYDQTEESKLWLTVWRGLKAVYLVLRENDYNLRKVAPIGFPAEYIFFDRITLRNQFETILSGPEALYPQIIENVVGEYCILIAECGSSPDFIYDLLRLLNTDVITPSIFGRIETLAKTRDWNDTALRAIQKCTVRLNHISGGPAFIRRIDPRRSTGENRSYHEWVIEKAMLNDEAEPQSITPSKSPITSAQPPTDKPASPSPVTRSFVMPQAVAISPVDSSTVNPFDNDIGDNLVLHTDDEQNSIEPQLTKMHAVSAYDYAAYPFPETRALEVTNSRQISRELSQPGIHSRGALPEDVINRPPRHTWPPGTVSVWAKKLPIDPISVAKELWDVWRNKQPKRKELRQPKPYPAITPRRPRKDWVDEHPRLRPLYDRKRRVAKNARGGHDHHNYQSKQSHQEHSHQIKVPKLRGGGTTSNDIVPESTVYWPPAPPTNTTRAAYDEMFHRTQILSRRLSGYWRGGDVPSHELLREHFLIPNNWDVAAAHEAARRFIDYGLLEKTSVGMICDIQDKTQGLDQTPCTQDPVTNTCPFVEFGVTPKEGLCPTKYGLPLCRGVTLFGSQSDEHHDEHRPGSSVSNPQNLKATRRQSRLSPPLQAHLLLGDDQVVDLDLNDDVYSTAGLPASIRIGENSSGPFIQASQVPSSSYPPGNQEQQAQMDRRHYPPTSAQRSPPTQSTQSFSQPVTPVCNPVSCHPCPQYTGQFHHVCRPQEQHDDTDTLFGSNDMPQSPIFGHLHNNITQFHDHVPFARRRAAAHHGNNLPLFDPQSSLCHHSITSSDQDDIDLWSDEGHINPWSDEGNINLSSDEDDLDLWSNTSSEESTSNAAERQRKLCRRAVRLANMHAEVPELESRIRLSPSTRHQRRRHGHHGHVQHVSPSPSPTDEIQFPIPSPVHHIQIPPPPQTDEAQSPSPSPTRVGGYNLRNRTHLAQQQQKRASKGRVSKGRVAKAK